MPEAISADVTAELLLWYYEEPRRYRAEGRRRDAPNLESTVVLKLALGRRVDFARRELSAPETLATLRQAAGMYVRFLFFRPEATPYQILGLTPGATPEAVKESFRLLMHLVHPDRQDDRIVWPESYAALANRAYGVLRNQDSRLQFDREAQARAAMARARSVNRTSEAAQASRMPVPVRPKRRRRGPLDGVVLPEWLTHGVGGFAREHPSVTAFSALIGAAVLAVALMVWEQSDGALTRDVDALGDATAGTPNARLPKLSWFSSTPSAPAAPAAPAPSGPSAAMASPKRSPLPDANAPASSAQTTAAAARVETPQSVTPVVQAGPQSVATNDAAIAALPPSAAAAPLPFDEKPPPEPPVPVPRQMASVEPASPPVSTAVVASSQTVASIVATAAANPVASAPAPTMARAEPAATAFLAPGSTQGSSPPATSEIESLFATFVESYERGRVDAFVDLFDVDAEANLRRGRPAIRGEYDELFRLTQWRRMQLTRVNWKRVGNAAVAKGEITVKMGWRDGREMEQRLAMDMELVRRDGRVVIAKLSQQPRP